MALTASRKYSAKAIANSSGQVIYLPGSDIFDMPNALPGEIDLYNIDTIQRFPLGMKVQIGDNVFRYVEFGGTTVAGQVAQAEAPDAAHDDLNPTGTGSGAGVAAGDTIISTSDTITLVQDEYADGYMVTEADTGAGYTYLIESNDAAASNALYRIKMGLAVAIDATTDLKLVKSRWKEVIQAPTTLTGALSGVSVGVGADGSFGFLATRGPWAVETDGVVVIGQHVRASDAVAGAVEPLDRDGTAEDEPEIGRVVDVGPDNEWSLIDLSLDG